MKLIDNNLKFKFEKYKDNIKSLKLKLYVKSSNRKLKVEVTKYEIIYLNLKIRRQTSKLEIEVKKSLKLEDSKF